MNTNRVRGLLLLALVCAGIASGCQSSANRQLERDVNAELDPRNKWLEHKALSGVKQQGTQNEADLRTGDFNLRPVGTR